MIKLEINNDPDIGTFVIIERTRELDEEEREARRCSTCREIHNDDTTRLVLDKADFRKLRDLLNAISNL